MYYKREGLVPGTKIYYPLKGRVINSLYHSMENNQNLGI